MVNLRLLLVLMVLSHLGAVNIRAADDYSCLDEDNGIYATLFKTNNLKAKSNNEASVTRAEKTLQAIAVKARISQKGLKERAAFINKKIPGLDMDQLVSILKHAPLRPRPKFGEHINALAGQRKMNTSQQTILDTDAHNIRERIVNILNHRSPAKRPRFRGRRLDWRETNARLKEGRALAELADKNGISLSVLESRIKLIRDSRQMSLKVATALELMKDAPLASLKDFERFAEGVERDYQAKLFARKIAGATQKRIRNILNGYAANHVSQRGGYKQSLQRTNQLVRLGESLVKVAEDKGFSNQELEYRTRRVRETLSGVIRIKDLVKILENAPEGNREDFKKYLRALHRKAQRG